MPWQYTIRMTHDGMEVLESKHVPLSEFPVSARWRLPETLDDVEAFGGFSMTIEEVTKFWNLEIAKCKSARDKAQAALWSAQARLNAARRDFKADLKRVTPRPVDLRSAHKRRRVAT